METKSQPASWFAQRTCFSPIAFDAHFISSHIVRGVTTEQLERPQVTSPDSGTHPKQSRWSQRVKATLHQRQQDHIEQDRQLHAKRNESGPFWDATASSAGFEVRLGDDQQTHVNSVDHLQSNGAVTTSHHEHQQQQDQPIRVKLKQDANFQL